jgi:hypothetical protein
MRHRWWVCGLGVIALTAALVGCRGGFHAEGEPDRAESNAVPGGQCDISWGPTPLIEDVSEEAEGIAAAALSGADVSAGVELHGS